LLDGRTEGSLRRVGVVDFDTTVDAVAAMEGEAVDVFISGPDGESRSVSRMVGVLRRVSPPESLPPEFENSVGETSVVFQLDDSSRLTLSLWPTRFVSGRRVVHDEGVEIVTRDARIRIQRYRPAWG
jgi:hypothetical protein